MYWPDYFKVFSAFLGQKKNCDNKQFHAQMRESHKIWNDRAKSHSICERIN
jgi:hypothetical protein